MSVSHPPNLPSDVVRRVSAARPRANRRVTGSGTRRPPWRTALCAAGFLLAVSVLVPAQDVTEPSLKAAGLYKVAVYTEWPADAIPPGGPFNLCVLGDKALADAAGREMRGRTIGTHDIAVSALVPAPTAA